MKYRVRYKVLLLVYKCVHGQGPEYLKNLCVMKRSNYSLRSIDSLVLEVPRTRCNTFGSRAFALCGPTWWNQLPFELKSAESIPVFKKQLKTHLFSFAFDS